jgi:hypothetical protein
MTLTDARCEEINRELRELAASGYRNQDGSERATKDPSIDFRVHQRILALLPDTVRIGIHVRLACDRYTNLYAMIQASRKRYRNWTGEQLELSRELPPPASTAEITEAIEPVDFLNESSYADLCDLLQTDLYSHIDIGMHGENHYCLKPSLTQLEPEDHDVDWDDKRYMMPESVCGINISKTIAWTGNRPKDNSSDESSISNVSTGNDDTGFVFMQLGSVFYLDNARRLKYRKENKPPIQMPWSDTGFVLVIEIQANGRAGAPWLLFNFRPRNELEGSRDSYNQSDSMWGKLPYQKDQRICVKIGSSFSELQLGKEWYMTNSHGGEFSPQLVPAVIAPISSRGKLVRQKVFEDTRRGG